MKVIIQIPCLNEAETLPIVLAQLPRQMMGVAHVEVLVIDDGSSDDTHVVARAHGADHVLRFPRRRGLANAFQSGLDEALRLGADVIVNIDGDNQYAADAIPALIAPVLASEADIVIGDRQVRDNPHFSPAKRRLQQFGSWVVRTISGSTVPDTTSGFRAYSREAALRLTVLSTYSYTLETIIQASKLGLQIASVPIDTNPPTRPSRLQRNSWHFIKAQASTILRVYAFYEPLRTFSYLALPFILTGLVLLGRFGYFVLTNQSGVARFIQSVAIGTGLLVAGIFIALFGILADIASKHRQLTQETLYQLKKMALERPLENKESRY